MSTNTKKAKRGRIGNEEIDYIKKAIKRGEPIDKIATVLNKTVETIRKTVVDKNLVAEEDVHSYEQGYLHLKHKLHNREYWPTVKELFTKDELEYFETMWVELFLQFREDVLFSEEIQLKQLITVDILSNRCMLERKKHLTEIAKLESALQGQYKLPADQRQAAFVASLETQLSAARASLVSFTTEFAKLMDKQRQLHSDLKATRDQRLRKVENAKTSFATWIRALEDEAMRERVGDEMELMKIAKEHSKDKLSQWHTYADDTLDQPVLTSDTVKD